MQMRSLARRTIHLGAAFVVAWAITQTADAQQGQRLFDRSCADLAQRFLRADGTLNTEQLQTILTLRRREIRRLYTRTALRQAFLDETPEDSYFTTREWQARDERFIDHLGKWIDCIETLLRLAELGKKPPPLPNVRIPPEQAKKVKPDADELKKRYWQMVANWQAYRKKMREKARVVGKPTDAPGLKPLTPISDQLGGPSSGPGSGNNAGGANDPGGNDTTGGPDPRFIGNEYDRLVDPVNVPVGGPKGGDFGLDFGIKYERIWGPDLKIGLGPDGGPYHRFDNDNGMVIPELNLWFILPRPLFGHQTRIGIGIEGGATSGDDTRGDVMQPGFITIIDGSNPALTPITGTQNTRLSWNRYQIAGNLWGAADVWAWRRRVLFTFVLGLYLAHQHLNYKLTEEVSGGGPFFTNNLAFKMAVAFYGVRMGIYATQRLMSGLSLTLGGSATPGYQSYKLNVTQTGTALGDASVQSRSNGAAARFDFGAKLNYDPTKRLRISFELEGTYDTSSPTFAYPSTGGQSIRARRRGAWGMRVGLRLSWAF